MEVRGSFREGDDGYGSTSPQQWAARLETESAGEGRGFALRALRLGSELRGLAPSTKPTIPRWARRLPHQRGERCTKLIPPQFPHSQIYGGELASEESDA
ncbi:hypothetical protein GCM10009751_29960 [Myceligenerans crystallogenes]|uniref:Uncharacterized protein n=1 Tax=Myceligenerans crystallogenes TaxID=316335 RepID=A0ABP4ZRV4_9MICO